MTRELRTYSIQPIRVNGVRVTQVVIDPHYEAKHQASVTDRLILELVGALDGREEIPEAKSGAYSYFVTLIEHGGKQYRLIWLLEDKEIYIGVVNAYRDRRKKK